jgi:hypothetical protein
MLTTPSKWVHRRGSSRSVLIKVCSLGETSIRCCTSSINPSRNQALDQRSKTASPRPLPDCAVGVRSVVPAHRSQSDSEAAGACPAGTNLAQGIAVTQPPVLATSGALPREDQLVFRDLIASGPPGSAGESTALGGISWKKVAGLCG